MADRIVDPDTGVSIREMAGRGGTDTATTDTMSRMFLCRGSTDPLVCRTAIINQKVPLQLEEFANLFLDSLSWKLSAGPDQWEFSAEYSWTPKPGEFNITMDSTGGTVTQTEAYVQSAYPAPSKSAVDFGYSVNVQPDGKVAGVERVIPALKLVVNARIATQWAADPIAYAKACAQLTGWVNSTSYLTFAAGELLYTGASGQIVGDNPLISHNFMASSNRTGFQIGPITGVTKAGHDYLWVAYDQVKDANTKKKSAIARAAYVSRVYGWADFGPLRIGEL